MTTTPDPASRVDLHLHSTASDGAYTPAQLVDLARRSGLAALALTDHDTVAGVAAAQSAAAGGACELVPGIELTVRHTHRRTLHLLGYFFDPDDGDLLAALDRVRAGRAARIAEIVGRLRDRGVSLDDGEVAALAAAEAPGRRQLAALLVKEGRAATVRQAFTRYLSDASPYVTPAVGLPVAEAIRLLHAAGGVASLAHPSYDGVPALLAELQVLGLDAVEVEYPNCRPSWGRQLRTLAGQLGLAVTGGSDCHGPDDAKRAPGACGVRWADLQLLRQRISAR
jgi:predicted metal-dependent phosphoesterase TrpH